MKRRISIFRLACTVVAAYTLGATGLRAQEPPPQSLSAPGGIYYYGGLTRDEASAARSDFHQRMRATRYEDERALFHFVVFDHRHLSTVIVLGYRFLERGSGETVENWILAVRGFGQGAENPTKWTTSHDCPQALTVIENFRQSPTLGLDFFGPGRRWPPPVQRGMSFEVSAHGVMHPDNTVHGWHTVTYTGVDGPLAAFAMNALRELSPCWVDEMPQRPAGQGFVPFF